MVSLESNRYSMSVQTDGFRHIMLRKHFIKVLHGYACPDSDWSIWNTILSIDTL